jgi:alpha-tubulin suppressor-like RCC1 family protein
VSCGGGIIILANILFSKVQIAQVSCGGDMLGGHTLALSKHGRTFAWGYGPACGIGSSSEVRAPVLVRKYFGVEQQTAAYKGDSEEYKIDFIQRRRIKGIVRHNNIEEKKHILCNDGERNNY